MEETGTTLDQTVARLGANRGHNLQWLARDTLLDHSLGCLCEFLASEVDARVKAGKGADPEDQYEYKAENVFWVPPPARWSFLQNSAKQPTIGKIVDDAMVAIERDNPRLKGVLPKDYARPALDKHRLGELIDLIGTIGLGDKENRAKDILGRVYEYFLSQFASAEGKKGGQFYTPSCIVRLLVEMLAPYKGRIYDCGLWFLRRDKSGRPPSTRPVGHPSPSGRRARDEGVPPKYEDVPGFCKSATTAEIAAHSYVLTPGRYAVPDRSRNAASYDSPGLSQCAPLGLQPGPPSSPSPRNWERP